MTEREFNLVQVPFGSYLYGTNGPSSDLDFKVLTLPALTTLMLNMQVSNRKVKPIGKGAGGKMEAGEAEYEYIPLQVFFDDFFNGQTYALELAFAIQQGRGEMQVCAVDQAAITTMVDILLSKYLTNSVQKMVGYAISQSQTYGLKTQRYTTLRDALALIETYFAASLEENPHAPRETTPNSTPDLLQQLLALPHVKEVMIENANGGSALAPALDVCGKKFPYTNKWTTIIRSLDGTLANYGNRVKAYDVEGVDWKALSHAIRITEQILELSKTGKLAFPRPNAQFLKAVKGGQVPESVATEYLTTCFDQVDSAVANSTLRQRTRELEDEFVQFKIESLKHFYSTFSLPL